MTVAQILPVALTVVGLSVVSTLVLIVAVKMRRGRSSARSTSLLAPYRSALVAIASDEDEDGQAKAALYAVPESVWARLRPSVVAFLPKVRGVPADNLCEVMRAHGELEEANRRLTSRSAFRRARAAYLLGLVRDPRGAVMVLPLLSDHASDVRLVATRALGAIGDPAAANGVLQALHTQHGHIGVPAWAAAEALLAMGVEIGQALQTGLASDDPAVRNVCAMVAGHGTFASTLPQLRVLLATDSEPDVRASGAVALGRIGGADDVASLVRHTDASEPTVLRRIAATALGDLGQCESLQTLSALLSDGDPRLARLAAESLVRIGPEGISRLEEAASGLSTGAWVASAALELAALRGQLPAMTAGVR